MLALPLAAAAAPSPSATFSGQVDSGTGADERVYGAGAAVSGRVADCDRPIRRLAVFADRDTKISDRLRIRASGEGSQTSSLSQIAGAPYCSRR